VKPRLHQCRGMVSCKPCSKCLGAEAKKGAPRRGRPRRHATAPDGERVKPFGAPAQHGLCRATLVYFEFIAEIIGSLVVILKGGDRRSIRAAAPGPRSRLPKLCPMMASREPFRALANRADSERPSHSRRNRTIACLMSMDGRRGRRRTPPRC
jgi:hypothetical protein